MDYGNLLGRAWKIVWAHKHLIGLGVVAALSNGGGFASGSNYQVSGDESDGALNMMPGSGQFEAWMGVAAIAIIALIGFFVVVALVIWVVSLVARGGLIAGVELIEDGKDSSFGVAWRAGWQRVWTLIGVGLVPLIPMLVLFGMALGVGWMFFVSGALFGDTAALRTAAGGVIAIVVSILCIAIPVVLALILLSTFAYRACMLEETGVWASYRRGWGVLVENVGPALILFLLQIVISIGLAFVLFVPGLIVAMCCLLWPLLLVVQGVITAYFSALWTLAWREWTGRQPTAALDVTV